MPWEIVVLLKILAGSVLTPFAVRLLGASDMRERVESILLQFILAASLALVAISMIGGPLPSLEHWQIALIGAFMPVGVFFQWKVYSWSMSRGVIFGALVSVIPLLLSGIVLGEWGVFIGKSLLLVGFGLTVLGIVLRLRQDTEAKRREEGSGKVPLALYWYGLAFVPIFGIGSFLQNFWTKGGIEPLQFMSAWYLGASISALTLFALTRHLQKAGNRETMLPAKKYGLIALAGGSIFLNTWFSLLLFAEVEQTVVLPLFAIGDIIGPLVLGLFVFGERKSLSFTGWLYLGCGVVGAALIMIGR